MKVDRHTKTKKSIFCNLEIFCVRDKDFPVEVVEHKGRRADKPFVDINSGPHLQTLSWTSPGSRKANGLLLCHPVTQTSEIQDQVSPLRPTSASTNSNEAGVTSSSFVSKNMPQVHPQTSHGDLVPDTLTSRTSNTIRWSPRGRHVVLATVGSSTKSELEFWDLDFNVEEGKRESAGDSSGIQPLGTADHYGVTDVEWDPSGRYLATSASAWRHTVRVSRSAPCSLQ